MSPATEPEETRDEGSDAPSDQQVATGDMRHDNQPGDRAIQALNHPTEQDSPSMQETTHETGPEASEDARWGSGETTVAAVPAITLMDGAAIPQIHLVEAVRQPGSRWLDLTFPAGRERLVKEYCSELNRRTYRGHRVLRRRRKAAYIPDLPNHPCTIRLHVPGHMEVTNDSVCGITLGFRHLSTAKEFKKYAIVFENLSEDEPKKLIMPPISEKAFREKMSSQGAKVVQYGLTLWLGSLCLAERE
ncbi:hypothetical protein BR93DRAFT_967385 [Coniochaeta sp. PMI_546]|nr:hypothetical protein BR93DRAFT_967385 [Coniochaeta sp. PMI_546]